MYAKTSVAVLLSVAAATAAQPAASTQSGAKPTGTVVSMLIPGADHLPGNEQMPLVGSIVDVKASMTTMAVTCPSGTDEDLCGMPEEGITITRGPTTEVMSTMYPAFGDGDDDEEGIMVGYAWECSIGGTTTAECVYKVEASATNADPSVLSKFMADVTASASTTQLDQKEMTSALFPVTVTAGAEKLAKSEPTAASEEASKASSASASGDAKNTASSSGDAKESASPTGDAAKASTTPGAASTVKVGGMGIAGALVALFML